MVLLVVLLTIVAFVVADLTLRMILKRIDQSRAKKERLEALDVGLKIEVAEEAHSLKRVEVRKPKARILAVDDEPVVLDIFRKILVLDGYSVDTVENGREALAMIQRREYDFVFTDLKMPEYDGLEVTKAVKQMRPDIDVVMITGYASIQSAVDAMKYGALDYVEKPFTEDELTAFVNRSLIRRQDRLEREQPPKIHLVTASSPETDSERVYNVPAGYFISPAHVWLKIEATGETQAGIDDFARKTIGELDGIRLPAQGKHVSRGQPLFTVKQRGRNMVFPSPVTGAVSAVNEELEGHPEPVSVNPYGAGWICRIEPENLAFELETLRIGAGAVEWYEEEIERFRAMSRELGEDFDEDDLWDAVSRSFLGA